MNSKNLLSRWTDLKDHGEKQLQNNSRKRCISFLQKFTFFLIKLLSSACIIIIIIIIIIFFYIIFYIIIINFFYIGNHINIFYKIFILQ